MKLSPLQLHSYQVLELSVAFRSEYDPSEPESDAIRDGMHAYLHLERNEEDQSDPRQWHVALRVSFEPPDSDNSRYNFLVGLLGTFICPDELPGGISAERLVGVNGSSILYGIARDLVLSITEKGPWEALVLPTMSFLDYQEMLDQSRDDESEIEDESSEKETIS